MNRRILSLLLSLCLLCPLFPRASAGEETPSPVTALCVAETGQPAFLDEKEFQLLCRQATGHDLESVTFSSFSAGVGKLTCRGERVTAETAYYMYRGPAISDVCFTPYSHSSGSFSGQAEVAFTMTSDEEETVPGTLILYVPEEPTAPAREPSLMDKTVAANTGEPVELCDHLPSAAEYKTGAATYCHEEIASAVFDLPFSHQGALWLDYEFEDSRRKLLPGEVLFPDHWPNYHSLTFVPAGKEEAEVRLNYTVSSEKKKNLPACLTLNLREHKETVLPAVPDTASVPTVHFSDMNGWEWAAPAAEFLGRSGYLSDETVFSPGENATRMDLIHALALTAYSHSRWNALSPAFSDLPDDPELLRSVAAVADRGLVLGNGEGLFLPNEHITRQDALVILYRAMVDRSKPLPLYGDLSAFSDAGDVSPYAREAVTILTARGIVLGDGSGKLSPLSTITRAEMACLLYRAFG